ncbi:50S ribosomal protein L36 [Motilibacter deserti]|nr:50S ribosomal protein L36 [Motilibacter deserti]
MKNQPGRRVVRRRGPTHVINTLDPRFKTHQA